MVGPSRLDPWRGAYCCDIFFKSANLKHPTVHIGKSQAKVNKSPRKMQEEPKTKDLIKDSLLEIRGTQKSKEMQIMVNETLATKPMANEKPTNDAIEKVTIL